MWHVETHESHLNVKGVHFFRSPIWTEISHKLHYQPDPTARNGSLDMWEPEMWRTDHKCVLIVSQSNLKKRVSHQIDKLEILTLESP